jgi:hypothetical protein
MNAAKYIWSLSEQGGMKPVTCIINLLEGFKFKYDEYAATSWNAPDCSDMDVFYLSRHSQIT